MTDTASKHTSWMSYANGKKYEQIALALLKQHFPQSQVVYTGGDAPGAVDFTVDGLTVEVKGSKARRIGLHRHAFQFLLQCASKGPHVASDLTLLLCVDHIADRERVDTFVIPSERVAECKCITISSAPQDYRGRYAMYFECWDWFVVVAHAKKIYSIAFPVSASNVAERLRAEQAQALATVQRVAEVTP